MEILRFCWSVYYFSIGWEETPSKRENKRAGVSSFFLDGISSTLLFVCLFGFKACCIFFASLDELSTEILMVVSDQIVSCSKIVSLLGLYMEKFWRAAFWDESRHFFFFFWPNWELKTVFPNYLKQKVCLLKKRPDNIGCICIF